MSNDWGVEAEISSRFELLRKLELPGPGAWLAGRERSSGVMRWLLMPTNPEEGFHIEALCRRLNGASHANLLELAGQQTLSHGLAGVFHWHGEEPLSDSQVSSMPAADRLRCAAQLVEVLYYLQQNARPVAHGGINVSSLWLTPSLRWCRLGGFNPGAGQGSETALQEDRRAALNVLSRLFLGDAVYSSDLQELEEAGEQWIEEHHGNWDRLRNVVKRAYLDHVAVNL